LSLKEINILFIADIVGQPGLDITLQLLPGLKQKYKANFCVANGENGAKGKGLTLSIANKYFDAGVDVITSGNHIWENPAYYADLANSDRVLRPLNYPEGNPGRGYTLFTTSDDVKIGVINLQGRTFMYSINCPFRTATWAIGKLKKDTNIILVDIHAEATAEKSALGWYLDGQVSAVIGTHTHVQTADERLLPQGTAYITDVGMTGAFDSVIGMKTEIAIQRFMYATPRKYQLAEENLKLCGAVVAVNVETGKATSIRRIQIP